MNQPTPSQPLASTSQLPPSSTAQPSHSPSPPSDPFLSPDSDASKASSDSSSFNKLLAYSRSLRLSAGGTQGGWDYATGQYHVPLHSAERFSGVERAEIDPNAPQVHHHPTSVTISQDRGDKEFEFSGDEGSGVKARGGGGGQMFTETGRPRRSRQAMTRG